jgi:hypothetical protein
MTFNELSIEVIFFYEIEARRAAAMAPARRWAGPLPPLVRPDGPRHAAVLWLSERLIGAGERLRAWSLPEPAAPCATEGAGR